MKHALVIGASGGIGRAVAEELTRRGVAVTTLSRRDDGLDITDPASVAEVMGRQDGPFDLIFVATGILSPDGTGPEKSVSAIEAAIMAEVLAVNAIGPALVVQAALPLLPRDTPSVLAVMSARVGSIGDNKIGGWHSYRASKAALNQIVRGTAIEMGRTHKKAVCVALHPGTVATPFTADYAGRHKTVPPDEAARNLVDVLTGLEPAQSGRFFDYSGAEVPW
ncbi:SDR family oxidoreductase [Ponticoccus sp. SC2-23]|uniref:SDR family oxidoreductase n=1 Tax=Alexandriicola marinus TaxID=2081710 RepID=UPI000FD99758|nr:SDR family oxidoreductase [Alexandriicola marinus]MBM1219722.1 SDR family oxidoreductase [Ponticoccus sp. SC6-9]MBM1223206.1 SDR family oxidoreductase [Ponticoccus sp. SC6-15]MBM1229535.1 SDR family oxidoreductase [Ponticoccus sp. SC6-38]MBM1232172.1 SDR family oxidoreductase [Ponticoccus sp. SC6-45]MBM1237878.1 SDR family oxidoreductase [Ponticoccus sp. SC6-49]MBM1241183.1 SDR family oxidoreductase [Ponticoccus sp. SC2-64]MBM1245696.1 SDR family oxidoreductase [Ponticoccus sp. SC6-42]MB